MSRATLLASTALAQVPPAPLPQLPPYDAMMADGTVVELKTTSTVAERRAGALAQAAAYVRMTGRTIHLEL